MLDRATEDALYTMFGAFFHTAEEERRWNLWSDVPWDAVNPVASDTLVDAVFAAFDDELFLPDYVGKLVHLLRSSRGRAWFLTRWSYEEGKHLLALNEWLLRSGRRSEAEMKKYADDLLSAEEWELPFTDPAAMMVWALMREYAEGERYSRLRAAAESEAEGALVSVLDFILRDETAQQDFLRDALLLIKERHAPLVDDATRRVAASEEGAPFAERLLADLEIG